MSVYLLSMHALLFVVEISSWLARKILNSRPVEQLRHSCIGDPCWHAYVP